MRFALSLVVFAVSAFAQSLPWTQWGGPNRNFITTSPGLAASWPAQGPKVLWKRPLGEGYSSILVENGVLYTMYGRSGREVVLAADAATGKTLWEHETAVSFHNDASERGDGPHATALLVGDRLFTTGVAGRFECLDKRSGNVVWSHQLAGSRLIYGDAASPLAYRDLIILPVGGSGKAIAAFRQSDGSVAWMKNQASNAYSSPLLISVDGVDQVVQVMAASVFAVNPLNGDLQWTFEHKTPYGLAVPTPVWMDGLLFVTSGYGAGSRMIELRREGNAVKAKELWSTVRFGVHHGNAVRIGDALYFSSGNNDSAPFTAIDARSGNILWQDRVFPKSVMVYADAKLIVLDQDGTLAMTRVSQKGVQVLARAQGLLTNNAWTPPTLVGTKLYLRDRHNMMAVELGR